MSDEIRPQLFVKHPDGTYSEYQPTGIETGEPRDAIEAHVRQIQQLCDYSNLDPTQWLNDYTAQGEAAPAQKANVRAPEVCGCPYGQCHCDDGSENGSPR